MYLRGALNENLHNFSMQKLEKYQNFMLRKCLVWSYSSIVSVHLCPVVQHIHLFFNSGELKKKKKERSRSTQIWTILTGFWRLVRLVQNLQKIMCILVSHSLDKFLVPSHGKRKTLTLTIVESITFTKIHNTVNRNYFTFRSQLSFVKYETHTPAC